MVSLVILVACIDPVKYGAVADDGKDDAPAIQKAIDAAIAAGGGDVCLGAGEWDLDYGKRASIRISGGPVTLYGVGAKTILRMHGSPNHRDWRAIAIDNAHDIVLRDMTIDGLDATDTREQTHLVELGPDSHDVTITDMVLGPMRHPDQKVGEGIGGDCLRLVGGPGHEIKAVSVVHTKFVNCDRSGIGIQRALDGIVIAHDEITGTGDADIDFEPSGHGSIVEVVMTDLTIRRSSDAQGPYAITIAGVGEDLAKHIVLAHSTLENGGVGLGNVDGVEIFDTTITDGPQKPTATINLIRRVANVRIARNTITRSSSDKAGPLIQAEHNNGEIPHDVVIEDNQLHQDTAAPVVRWASASHLVVRGNTIGVADKTMPVVDVTAVVADVEDVTITNNTVRGPASAVLRAHPRDHAIRKVELTRNRTDQGTRTMDCNKGTIDDVTLDDKASRAGTCKDVTVRIK